MDDTETEIAYAGVAGQAELIRNREISAVELTKPSSSASTPLPAIALPALLVLPALRHHLHHRVEDEDVREDADPPEYGEQRQGKTKRVPKDEHCPAQNT
jgi:hypothetical protein